MACAECKVQSSTPFFGSRIIPALEPKLGKVGFLLDLFNPFTDAAIVVQLTTETQVKLMDKVTEDMTEKQKNDYYEAVNRMYKEMASSFDP